MTCHDARGASRLLGREQTTLLWEVLSLFLEKLGNNSIHESFCSYRLSYPLGIVTLCLVFLSLPHQGNGLNELC